jgi:hypothetical protein
MASADGAGASRRAAALLEHMHHGETENGNLICTYDDFERAKIDRKSIRMAIAVAEALGFIDIVSHGMRGYGIERQPSRYALTWLPRNDDIKATKRWKVIEDPDEAKKFSHDEALDISRPDNGTRLQLVHVFNTYFVPILKRRTRSLPRSR